MNPRIQAVRDPSDDLDHDPWDDQAAAATPDLPAIQANNIALDDAAERATAALVAANGDDPIIFRQGNALARVVVDGPAAVLDPLSRSALRHHLARVAIWQRHVRRDGETVALPAAPPLDVVDDILAAPSWPFPKLERVVTSPTFAPDGTLQVAPGYQPATRTFYALQAGLTLPASPEHPTRADIDAARRLLVDDLLGDFCFAAEAEQAHALALLVLPAVRALIDGPTPFHLTEAPGPGHGKGKLVETIFTVSLGCPPGLATLGRSDDETRKAITSVLLAGHDLTCFDNIDTNIDSGVLAAALTARRWSDRMLGANRMVSLPMTTVWAATANNPATSAEIARRTVRIRLDSNLERPWLRRGFRHELPGWARHQRGTLLAAVHTLVRAWLDAGRPYSGAVLGSFEDWSAVVGGILEVAGINGFLGNVADVYRAADTESDTLARLVAAWWHTFGDRPVGIADLWPIASVAASGMDLGNGPEHSQRTRFGCYLRRRRDQVVGSWRIAQAGVAHQTGQWRLVRLGDHAP